MYRIKGEFRNDDVSFSDSNFSLSDIGLGFGEIIHPLDGTVNGESAKLELKFTPATVGSFSGNAKFCDHTEPNFCFEIPLKGEGIN